MGYKGKYNKYLEEKNTKSNTLSRLKTICKLYLGELYKIEIIDIKYYNDFISDIKNILHIEDLLLLICENNFFKLPIFVEKYPYILKVLDKIINKGSDLVKMSGVYNSKSIWNSDNYGLTNIITSYKYILTGTLEERPLIINKDDQDKLDILNNKIVKAITIRKNIDKF